MKTCQILANFELVKNKVRRIDDVIGAVGGSLGLFQEFSFFDVISKCLDNLIITLFNYLFFSNDVVVDPDFFF